MSIMSSTYDNLSVPNLTSLDLNDSFLDDRGAYDDGYGNVSYEASNNGSVGGILMYTTVQAIFCIEYMTIFLLGVFGNCLVCYVVFRNKAMQNVTNFFIANLALADILLCVLAVPFTPLYTFMGEWLFGRIMCQLVAMAQGVSVYVSTLTLMSIAIDRFFVIIYPFRPRLRLPVCYLIIFFIWLFSVSATLPYAFYMQQVIFNERYFCEEMWPSENIRKVFGSFTAIMQFVVPFIIILYCYVKISVRMNDRVKQKPGSKNSRKEEADRERKKRTNRMLIAMVTIFGCSWLPVNVVHLVGDYYVPASSWDYYNLCFFIGHVIAMSSTCYNPFLYAWLNENFRKEFQLVLPCFHQAPSTDRKAQWRSERTCNGNDTQQETLAGGSGRSTQAAQARSNIGQAKSDEVRLCPESPRSESGAAVETHALQTFTAEPHDTAAADTVAPLVNGEASEYV